MGALTFKRVSSGEPVAQYVAEALSEHLERGQRVLWLLSGGSAIEIAVAASKRLNARTFGSLTVSLVDERFGPVGHADSNLEQLQKAGLELPGATIVPVLHGDDLQVTARKFEVKLQGLLSEADYCLALFGIGSDHHTAGILPRTPAVTAMGIVCGYETPQFMRITMTPEAFPRLHEAVAYVVGDAKREPIEALQQDKPPSDYPSQFLKRIPKVTIFNDQIGEA